MNHSECVVVSLNFVDIFMLISRRLHLIARTFPRISTILRVTEFGNTVKRKIVCFRFIFTGFSEFGTKTNWKYVQYYHLLITAIPTEGEFNMQQICLERPKGEKLMEGKYPRLTVLVRKSGKFGRFYYFNYRVFIMWKISTLYEQWLLMLGSI